MPEETSTGSAELTAIDTDDSRQACRFIADGKCIKYVMVHNNDFEVRPPGILIHNYDFTSFPPLPEGDWRVKQVVRDMQTGQPKFVDAGRFDQMALRPRGVRNAWHPIRIDYFDADLRTVLRAVKGVQVLGHNDQLRLVTHPAFSGGTKPVLMKTFDFPMDRRHVESETRAYRILAGKGLAPEFLGHVTAEGLIIGFFLEWMDAGTGGDDRNRYDNRLKHPGLEDKELCIETVGRLHNLGIVHGDLHPGNMLLRPNRVNGDPSIIFIDFETTRCTEDPSARQKDITRMIQRLQGNWELSIGDFLYLGDYASSDEEDVDARTGGC